MHIKRYGKGKPLILIHGWGMHGEIWTSLVESLIDDFAVYVIDLPGHGQAKGQLFEPNSIIELMAKQLPDDAIIAGWSMGGVIALDYARRHPDKVSHLIGVCTSAKFVSDSLWPGMTESMLNLFKQKLNIDFRQCIDDFLYLQLNARHAALYKQLPELVANPYPDVAALECGLELLASIDLREHLHHLSMPCWFVFGLLDKIISAQTLKVMQQNYPQFQYSAYKRHAHLPFITNQLEFINDLKGFINV